MPTTMSMRRAMFLLGGLATALVQAEYLPRSVWGKYRCPADNSTLPSPTYFKETTIFSTCAENIIDAPINKVYDAVINFGNYHLWNTFVRNVTLVNGTTLSPPTLGTEVLFTTYGLLGKNIPTQSHEIMSFLQPAGSSDNPDPDYAFASWKFDDQFDSLAIRAEHPNVLQTVDLGNGKNGTLYVSWESYYLLPAVLADVLLANNLRQQFANQGNDLKKYVEAMAGGSH